MGSDKNRVDPLQNLFEDIKKILSFIEIKDQAEADKYETAEIAKESTMWMHAKLKKDNFVTYVEYWDYSMFAGLITNLSYTQFIEYKNKPYSVPMLFRDSILEKGRNKFLSTYEEKNEYYRRLNGLPPIDEDPSNFIYLSEPLRNQLHASSEPIHLLSPLIQNNYICTDEYKNVLENNPDKKYLNYLGIYKIDIFTARSAKDFDIIRYILNRSDINPNLINVFSELYASYREYVMVTLYNEQLVDLYKGYREFMGQLILIFTLMQIPSKSVESITSRKFLDDTILHIILDSYNIDDNLILASEIRRNLVINMLKLTQEKGTNEVYHSLVEILGYNDIVISKLMLMKGQKFDKDTGKVDGVEPYFLQMKIDEKNPYDAIIKGDCPIYDYHSIIDKDPTWWDTEEVQEILKNGNYSMTESKYIVIEAIIHQMDYLFESIYFSRMVLDNKSNTDTFMIEIPELFGSEPMSIYDLMVASVTAMCMINGLTGEIITDESKLLATAGFNFEMDFDLFNEYLSTTEYVDKDRLNRYINNLTVSDKRDITRLFNEVLYPLREWLEYKIVNSSNRYEYVEYENIYRSLYTYDITHNTFLNDFELPLVTICKKYGITQEEIKMYQHFYPRRLTGESITIDEFLDDKNPSSPASRYGFEFLSNNEIDFYIRIDIETPNGTVERGILYFNDILNCEDVRLLRSYPELEEDASRIFMDKPFDDQDWVLNEKAVQKALELIDQLDDNILNNAYFGANTPVLNSGGIVYYQGTKLPNIIRSSIYKEILKDKILMDVSGYGKPPVTYQEYLYRKNRSLYNLLIDGNRFELNKSAWMDDVFRIILAIENALDLHLKYFEQATLGQESFFRPLISLINHFKSTFVDIAKTGMRFVFDDKIDAGGNSNMFRLFDEVRFMIHFITLQNTGYNSQFGLYDTEHAMKHNIMMKDRSEILKFTSKGFDAQERTSKMGSMHMFDEMKFFTNGKEIDPNGHPSMWYSGEPDNGRWSEEDDVLMRIRKDEARVLNIPIDLDGWKEYVESYFVG